MKLSFHKHGVKDKLIEYNLFKREYNFEDENIAYIGDDIITSSKGGDGALRDIADYILESQGLLEELIEKSKRGK